MRRFGFAGLGVVVALSVYACSSDSTTGSGTGTGTDGGSSGSDAGSAATDGGGTTTKTVNGCSSYTDKTGGGATITWDLSASPPSTCLKIKKGGTVTFNGSFSSHPLLAKDGDSPTPFNSPPSGTTATIAFPNAGTFGFICGIHSSMTGAIQVVE